MIAITNKPGVNRLFILDCCRSDILANRSGTYSCGASRNIALNAAVQNNSDKSIIPPLILSSCSTGECAFEKENHGFFTEVLLKSIDDRTITSFRDFQQSLRITGTPEPQNISWNGNLIYWENIKLFGSWSAADSAANQTGRRLSKYDVQFYEIKINELTKELTGKIPPEVEKYIQIAEQASADGEYDSAIRLYVQAMEQLQKTADKDPEELCKKAKLLYDNENYEEAVKLWRKAAEQNHADSQFFLGACYFYGNGVMKSLEESLKWHQKAAESGHVQSQFIIGCGYYHGEGVPQSYTEAAKWYRKAAEQNHFIAQNNLGNAYYYGDGVPQSYEEAAKWYRKAAEQNYAEAQYFLGLAYYHGKGVPQSYEEAVKWFLKAAEQNNINAQVFLGICYQAGYGVAQSCEEAVKWFQKTAEKNHEVAQYSLGICYENGFGVKLSKEQAAYWYQKAVENGYEKAKEALERVTKES